MDGALPSCPIQSPALSFILPVTGGQGGGSRLERLMCLGRPPSRICSGLSCGFPGICAVKPAHPPCSRTFHVHAGVRIHILATCSMFLEVEVQLGPRV